MLAEKVLCSWMILLTFSESGKQSATLRMSSFRRPEEKKKKAQSLKAKPITFQSNRAVRTKTWTFIMVMAMYRASFTIMGSYVASSFGVGNPPKVRSGPVDEGEEPPGSRCSFFTFSGCTDFFCETGTALTSTWRRDTADA